ncbi:MAG: hypothetical protein JSR40_13730 [Proteobacteria bacterium]|nr:hypothetical protein [Pseudomonadota bacterium]
MTNRHGLAVWSLEVDDARFAQACAALGALNVAVRRWRRRGIDLLEQVAAAGAEDQQIEFVASVLGSMRDGDRPMEWELPPSAALARFPSANALAAVWQKYVDEQSQATRIAVRSRGRAWCGLLPMLRTLQHEAVGAGSVFVADAFTQDGRVDWELPFAFAALPDDPLAPAFTGFRAHWREPWPYRFTLAERSQPRAEMLVFSGSLRLLAGRLLTKGATTRATLVLVLGGMDEGADAESLARIVARELSAEGLVCVTPPAGADADWRMQALVWLGDELTHNRPLDLALSMAFRQDAIAFLSRDLVRLSQLSNSVARISGRLKALPPDASLAVSERSLGDLVRAPEVVGLQEIWKARWPQGAAARGAGAAPPMSGAQCGVSPEVLARSIDASRGMYGYAHESDQASSLTELNNAVKAHEAARAAREPETRYVQHSFWRTAAGELVEERQRLTVGTAVMLRVRIGPLDEHWQAAPDPFPAHELPRNRRRHRLQIVFHEPTQLDAPMMGELWLPRSGPSSVAEFVFTPRKPAQFQARITVLHRGRVLQTVLIHTRVVSRDAQAGAGQGMTPQGITQQGITQQIEARVREHWSDLDTRRRFDASFVLNHTSDDRPLLTGVSGKRAWATDLEGIRQPVEAINQLLSDVAHSVADYSEGLTEGDNLKLFYKLARVGGDLYSALVIDHLQQLRSGGMDVEEATHIQIVSTRADAVVPFEFIYQYLPPDDENDVRFCPDALRALKEGACPGQCDGQKEPGRHVCPMGFWGLRKVIERHVYNPAIGKPDDAEVIVQAEPAGDRVRLQLDQAAVVGYSNEVKPDEVGPVLVRLAACLRGPVQEVKDWDEWKACVTGNHPTLLVAFPHNTGDKQDIALEIGGKAFKTLRLPREYVHVDGPYPLVMLLGCDVASTAQQYASHIRYFRQAGAAAVVSTIATVFGPHAVKVGGKLLEGLLAIRDQGAAQPGTDNTETCLGEALRAVKRQALLDSLPMALCVVAFGDADWRL